MLKKSDNAVRFLSHFLGMLHISQQSSQEEIHNFSLSMEMCNNFVNIYWVFYYHKKSGL